MRRPFPIFALFAALVSAGSLPVAGRAEVAVFDCLTTIDTPVYLKVLTKGRFFAEGGRRVQLRLGEQKPRMVLSGGDGMAYLKIKPQQSGLFEIEAVSGSDRGVGHLLVIPPEAAVMIVGVENSLKMSLFSDQERAESQSALTRFAERFRIVYVTEWLNHRSVKEWLAEKKYPLSVVLRWQGGDALKSLKKRGVSVAAVIGSEAMLKAAGPQIENRYSFGKSRSGKTVEDWDDIEEAMHPVSK